MVLETTSESPLCSKEIKPVNLKGDQPWIFIGRTEAEAETPGFWSSDENRQLIGKVPDAGKDWRQKEKRASWDEMAGCLDCFFLRVRKRTLLRCNSCQVAKESLGPWKDPLASDLAVSNKCSTFILTLLEEFDWNYICPDNTQQSALLAFVSRYIWKQERWPWTQLLFQFRTSLWVYWRIFLNIENSTNGKTF